MVLILSTEKDITQEELKRFRPLAGIMVLIYGMSAKALNQKLHEFPSPCGDYGSYHNGPCLRTLTTAYSFRPLAGIMVLILADWLIEDERYEFPSPCGDYGSYPWKRCESRPEKTDSFRPLAGIMVLIDLFPLINDRINREFPSPCGDYGSYCISYIFYMIHMGSFRPLAGIMVLIAPFINAFMKPSKWHFAGRIIYFHHFLSFAGK